MKSFLLLFFISLSTLTIAQKNNDYTFFIDSLGNAANESNYKYIRVIEDYHIIKTRYTVKDYYKSDNIAFIGTARVTNPLIISEICTRYYENGNKKLATNFIENTSNLKQTAWYENGNLKFEKEFIYNELNGKTTESLVNYLDENNIQKVINGNGQFTEEEKEYIKSGEIKNGLKEGVWNWKHSKLNTRYTETYKNGAFISGESFDENNISYKYNEIETPAKPVGDMIAFYNYINSNFYVGRISIDNNLKGRIFIEFVVNKNGEIVQPKIIRDIGFGTGEEVLRVLKKAKNWIPATLRGIPTDSKYSLPILVDINIETKNVEVGIWYPNK